MSLKFANLTKKREEKENFLFQTQMRIIKAFADNEAIDDILATIKALKCSPHDKQRLADFAAGAACMKGVYNNFKVE